MVEAPAQVLEDGDLAVVAGGEIDMAALAGERCPTAGRGDQARDAEPRARPEHADRGLRDCLVAAHLPALTGAQARHCQRDGGEVVDHEKRLETECALQGGARKPPGVVGHFDPVAEHRRGDGQCRVPRRGSLCVRQRDVDGGLDVRMVGRRQEHRLPRALAWSLQREARVGAADVGDQARPRLAGAHCAGTSTRIARKASRKRLRQAWTSSRRSPCIIVVQRSRRSSSGIVRPR